MVREVKKKTLNVGGFAEPSKQAASKAVEAKRIAGKQIFYGGLEAEKRRRLSEEVKQFNRDFGGDPAVDKFNPKGTGMGDRFDPTAKNFFSPSKFGSEVAKVASSDVSNLNVGNNANEAVGIVNQATTNLADASYDSSYKQEKGYAEDSYEKIKQIFDKPRKKTVGELISEPAFKEATDRGRFGSEPYKDTIRLSEARRDSAYAGLSDAEAIDTFKRKNIRYGTDRDGTPTATDSFYDKVEYDTETLKRYIATDAKENYERREKAAKEESERRINKLMSDTAYKEAYKEYDKPSLLQRASNFLRGTDLKGEEADRNKYILSKDERLKRLREANREYNVPGITVSPTGFVDVPIAPLQIRAGQFSENDGLETKNKTSSEMSSEEFNRKYDKEYTKLKRMSEGKTPNPSLLERTTKFLGDVVGGVSKIFTPAAQAGGMPSTDNLANTFTSGQSSGGLSGLPSSMGDNISAGISGMRGNIGAAVEAGGMGGLNRGGSGSPRSSGRTVTIGGVKFRQSKYGRPYSRVQSPMESGMGPGAARARALAKARIAKKKKSSVSGQGGDSGQTTSTMNRSRYRGGAKSKSSSKGGGSSSGGGSGGSSSGGGSSSSSSSSGQSSGINRSRYRRRGRRRSRCDLRCKVDISLLTNMNLMRDDLAEVAYFVKELQA